MTYSEIAQDLEVSNASFKVYVSRCRKLLVKNMEKVSKEIKNRKFIMGPPGYTYEQVVDFIERTTIGLKDNLVNYDKDLLIEFFKNTNRQNHIDQYYNDITDEVLLDYLENQIYDEHQNQEQRIVFLE